MRTVVIRNRFAAAENTVINIRTGYVSVHPKGRPA